VSIGSLCVIIIPSRHPELVSGSLGGLDDFMQEMLKQVQHDVRVCICRCKETASPELFRESNLLSIL
jgi:hypothetical protein